MKGFLGALALVGVLTIFVTWPQAANLGTAIASHHDAYFSIWRVAWIAHALATSPLHLFDANIFYPATGTLAFSDAMLLEGLIATPLFWAHVPPVLIYNLLFLTGFIGSGMAMFVLARYLMRSTAPALVAAAVYTMAPYRIEHAMHLELQWAMWIPLAFWALHRAVAEESPRYGVLAGVFIWLQVISCVYYGVFLALTLLVFAPLVVVLGGRLQTRTIAAVAVAALVAAVLVMPYALPYLHAAQTLGSRDAAEIARYSARPMNYASASSLNWLWGWTADRWGARELRLYPGVAAAFLAIVSLANRSWRSTVVYGVVVVLAVEMSFGVNGVVYRTLTSLIPSLQGFRATARFAIVASAGLAVLSGLGAQAITERLARSTVVRRATVPAFLLLMAIDYANRPMPLTSERLGEMSPVYKVIQSAGPGVMLELPLPTPATLPGWDAYYSAWSITHWHPLMNGYSGYHPPDYLLTLIRMENFPDDASINRLRAHQVRYIVIHQAFYEPAQYTRLMLRMGFRPEFKPYGNYRDPVGNAQVFVFER